MSKGSIYYVILCISKGDFRIVLNDDKTVAMWTDWSEADSIRKQFQAKHPDVHYHIRTFEWEPKFDKEYSE